jgi:hypothetical protein
LKLHQFDLNVQRYFAIDSSAHTSETQNIETPFNLMCFYNNALVLFMRFRTFGEVFGACGEAFQCELLETNSRWRTKSTCDPNTVQLGLESVPTARHLTIPDI